MIIEFNNLMKNTKGDVQIPEPYERLGINSVKVNVDISTLPHNIPTTVNPRQTHVDSDVTQAIENSLSQNHPLFHELNRGLLIICESITIDRENNSVSIKVENDPYEGIADGGHTYRCILKYLDHLKEQGLELGNDKMYVPVEFVWGAEDTRKGYAINISIARNTAKAVSDTAIDNKAGKYNMLSKLWESQPWFLKVVYEDVPKADITINDILQILNIFNMSNCSIKDGKFNPKASSNTKSSVNKNYSALYDTYGESINNPYFAMRNIMIDIIKLYDLIETTIPVCANNIGIDWNEFETGTGRCANKFGKKKAGKSLFYENKKTYYCPNSFVKPILAALRQIVGIDENGFYKWNTNPYEFLKNYEQNFVKILVYYYSKDNNKTPSVTANNREMWDKIYCESLRIVENF